MVNTEKPTGKNEMTENFSQEKSLIENEEDTQKIVSKLNNFKEACIEASSGHKNPREFLYNHGLYNVAYKKAKDLGVDISNYSLSLTYLMS